MLHYNNKLLSLIWKTKCSLSAQFLNFDIFIKEINQKQCRIEKNQKQEDMWVICLYNTMMRLFGYTCKNALISSMKKIKSPMSSSFF